MGEIEAWTNQIQGEINSLRIEIRKLSDDFTNDRFVDVITRSQKIRTMIDDLKRNTDDHFKCPDEKIATFDDYGYLESDSGLCDLKPGYIYGIHSHEDISNDRRQNHDKWQGWLNGIRRKGTGIRGKIRKGKAEADGGSLLDAIDLFEGMKKVDLVDYQREIEQSPNCPLSELAMNLIVTEIVDLLEDFGEDNVDEIEDAHPQNLAAVCRKKLSSWAKECEWDIERRLQVGNENGFSEADKLSLYERYKRLYGHHEEFTPENVRQGSYGLNSLDHRIHKRCKSLKSARRPADAAFQNLENLIAQARQYDHAYVAPCTSESIRLDREVRKSWLTQIFSK